MSVLSRHAQRRSLRELLLGLKVKRERSRLDARLADGEDPASDPDLAVRAAQLADPSTRRAIATALANVLDAAEEQRDPWVPVEFRPRLQLEAIEAARQDLLTLADALRGPGVVPVPAAARAALLVWDSASPMYAPRTETSVRQSARAALGLLPPPR
jgi:hypothetical protein